MKKVLVIGASGSLGQGVIKEIKNKFEITGTYTSRPFDVEGVKQQQLNICNKKQFEVLDIDYDTVFLVAGAMPAMMKGYDPQQYIDVNITGVLNVLEYCRINNISKLVYIMTFSDMAGYFYNGTPIQDEGTRTLNLKGDHAVYSVSKVAACDLIEHYHQEYGLQTIIFRIPTVYCNDNNFSYYVDGELKTKGYIQMIQSIINNNRIELWGDTNHSKDMPYIKDFANLIEKAILHETAQGTFNAGTGDPVTLERFCNCLIEVFGEGNMVDKQYRPEKNSQPNFTFDMSKTFTTFNYLPEYTVEKMFLDIKNTLGIGEFK